MQQSKKLELQRETQHFKFYCCNEDLECLDDLENELENNFERISGDLNYWLDDKVEVKIYSSIDIFHIEVFGDVNRPNWLIGTSRHGAISIVSPLNPGPVHNYEGIVKIIVHEFTHIIIKKICPKGISIVLNEGIALFEAKQMNKSRKNKISRAIKNNKIPSFEELERDFVNNEGYSFAYTVVEYIVITYGLEKLNELIRDVINFEKILNVNKDVFARRWVEFLKKNYMV